MKRDIFILLIILTIFQTTTSFSWSKKEHSLVVEVAFNYLDPTTRKLLTEYLDGMTIQDAANWMDDIKSDKTYDYLRKQYYINAERGQKMTADCGENIIRLLTKIVVDFKFYK